MNTLTLYLLTLLLSAAVTAGSIPLLRRVLGNLFLDRPIGKLKHHVHAVPSLGGCAIFLGLTASLIFIRLTTNFPTGTLHSLRGILYGSALIFAIGIIDDLLKPKGVGVMVKLVGQCLAAACLVTYGVHITLFDLPAFYFPITFLWVIGITNAFNLLDISDGLCVSQAAVSTLGLWLITLPSEHIYVNFCACALLGACLGFWPFNHLRKMKTFLGDSGSTLLGFTIAALSMGAGYSEHSSWGFLAPLLILAVPIFDTTFVTFARISKLKNPFLGSNDHAALRLKENGLSTQRVLLLFLAVGLLFNLMAFAVTQLPAEGAVLLYSIATVFIFIATIYLWRLRIPQ